ncbi:hypothetical protein EQM14_04825 [Caproiciproducens sp. NJN-50]|uniref:hypothetical protein n=1 Tax=Caproiciproducens sp. NJN-50 TaxID=2507162 RepID=UPI000FFDFA61|nr:hypothetical protein [Caproiciproducens sp. NJN-50]QAT49152.1 hypothetical protein EQM14_04825 [Caproiciproducens sp. NJN-50]
MEHSNTIIGLPVLISARYRIVLDQGLCRKRGIPENGPVLTKIEKESIFIYPDVSEIPETERKYVTIGRFNLPALWAKQNRARIGRYAFLTVTESGLQVRMLPSTPRQCLQNRVYGVPIRIYAGNFIYIPKAFWFHYGIQPDGGNVVREEADELLLFRKFRSELFPDILSRQIHMGKIHVRAKWMRKSNLAVGDALWLYGTSEGPVASARPAYENLGDPLT